MAYKKIDQYGIVGNGSTLALIGDDGSVDWMCLPYIDSPAVFAAILDDKKGCRFRIQPAKEWDAVQHYIPRTNILQTKFSTADGEVELTDFMVAGDSAQNRNGTSTLLARRVSGCKGEVQMATTCSPRFQYGAKVPEWDQSDACWRIAKNGSEKLHLFTSRQLKWDGEQAAFNIHADESLWICTAYGEIDKPFATEDLTVRFDETRDYWQDWVRAQETGKYSPPDYWRERLDRAALTMKLLQFRETGAIAAGASCSLPTIIGGVRNWDYRFSWVRDTSMTLQALYELGHTREVMLYLEWLATIIRDKPVPELNVLYQLRSPAPPEGEKELEYLEGYKGSRPVLTGQFNVGQHQHDIYGELLDMIFSLSRMVGKIDPEFWDHIRRIVDHVVSIWREKDNGIWELRTGPHHITHSKVMCWVALDRGIKIAEHYGFPADLSKWKSERETIRADVLAKGFNAERQRFTMHYDTEEIDASLLQIPLVGFLPADDERVVNTIAAVEEELIIDGLPHRYMIDDGIPGQEHGWLICFFWYVRCLIRMRRIDEAEACLRRVQQYANHLGLMGEEYDPGNKEITGNFPQAFSHIGYATAILEYIEARRPERATRKVPLSRKIGMIFKSKNLSPSLPEKQTAASPNPGEELKRVMNILQGQFYDGHYQRVDYAGIRDSEYYQDFRHALAALQYFDPSVLTTEKSRIAFWTNLFNTLVIHAVIEHGIRESVKEVPFFFARSAYTIGGHVYSLSDIEHGILRGNKKPPYRRGKRMREDDPRLAHSIAHPDRRIHFALVCASRTCPPIDAYTAENLDQQLDTSAKVFINATTCLEQPKRTISISEIFKWYRADFADVDKDLISWMADYIYKPESAEWIKQNLDALEICYTPYDWRLNR